MIDAAYVTADQEVNPVRALQLGRPRGIVLEILHPSSVFQLGKHRVIVCDLDSISDAMGRAQVMACLKRVSDCLIFVHTFNDDDPDVAYLRMLGCLICRQLDDDLFEAIRRSVAA